MDGNKDEALKCLKIAKNSIDSGDRDRALKFINKARRLDPSIKIDDLLTNPNASQPENKNPNEVSEENPSDPSRSGPRRRVHAGGPPLASSSSSSSTSATYTEEQVAVVGEIKRKEDYYDILGLEKSCSAEDVRKAYRKLSLKV